MDTANTPAPPPEEWLSSFDALRERRSTFIVRIRATPQTDAPDAREWRGTVEHVQSQTVAHFIEWMELTRFIAAHSGIPPPPSGSSARQLVFRPISRLAQWLARQFHRTIESGQHSVSV